MRSKTEEEKKGKKIRENWKNKRKTIVACFEEYGKQGNILEESQKKLDRTVVHFINIESLEHSPGQKNDLKDLRTTIREPREKPR